MANLQKWVRSEYLQTISSWNWGCRRSIILLGRSKTGKSTAAAILSRHLLVRAVHEGGHPWQLAQGMYWYRAEELLAAQRGHPLGRGDPRELRLACSCPLLFLDELGWKEDADVIQTVVSARYERLLLTVATSGFSRKELERRYGDAVLRRLAQPRGLAPLLVEA